MRLADLGRREMAIIYITGLVFSAALLYQFVVSPELERYLIGRSRFDSQQQRNMRTVSRRQALLEEYLELRTKADKMQKLLFNGTGADDFQEQLPKLSGSTGNILKSIIPKDSEALILTDTGDSKRDKEKTAQLSEIEQKPIGVTIKGKYRNIIKLFRTLEGFKELMVVSDVGITSALHSTGEVEARFSLNLIHTRTEAKMPADEMLVNVSAMNQVAEATEVVMGLDQQEDIQPPKRPVAPPRSSEDMREGAISARSSSAARQKGAAAVEKNIRYAVQVGAFNIVKNSKTLAELLKYNGYEPWVRPDIVTGQAPHHVLVGKFSTKAEADRFGKLMVRELPWIREYIIKRTILDLNTVLREARTEE